MHKKFNSLTDDNCNAMRPGQSEWNNMGGMKSMGGAFKRDGMVLTFSLWDSEGGMSWLDTGNAGPCDASKEKASDINRDHPGAYVTWSKIKVGEIGSTTGGHGPTPPGPSGCPGGDLSSCMDLCPTSPPDAFKACVQLCVKDCKDEDAKFLPIQ